MPSDYSSLKIELIENGEQSGTWGTTTNTNLGTALEEAIVGRANAVFTSDADLTITLTDTNASQVARNYILNVTSSVSLTATRNLIVPTIDKPYIVENNTAGNRSIVVKTSGGTGITVPNGKTVMVYADGTNVVSSVTHIPSVTIAGGSIDNTTIGATTRAIGYFTDLYANGDVSLCSDSFDTLSINATNITINDELSFNTDALTILEATNFVGINTATPDRNLDVAGTCRILGELTIGDNGADTVICNSGSISVPNGLNIDNDTFFIDSTNNRIGIGTVTPAQPLDVTGNANVSSNLTVGGTATVTGTFSTQGNVNLGNDSADTVVFNASTVTAPNNLSFDSNTLYIDATNNRVGIGTASPTNPLSVSGNADVTSLSAGSITSAADLLVTPTGNFNLDSGTLFVNTTNNSVGVRTTTPATGSSLNVEGLLLLNAGTASVAPLKLTSGTSLTSAEAGAIEYDGTRFYATSDTSSGRGYVPSSQVFRLSNNGAAIGPAISNFFGANSAVSLAAGGVYELEAYLYFTKTTAGTIVVTLTTSLEPQRLSGTVIYGAAAGGTATGAANQISIYGNTTVNSAFGASLSLTATNHLFIVRALIEANTSASNLRIQVTNSAGTVTPLRNSYYCLTRLPSGNTGNFVA